MLKFVCYGGPKSTYEKFIERHCLRGRTKDP